MRESRGVVKRLGAAVLLLVLGACGGDTVTEPLVTQAPPPPPPRVVAEGRGISLPAEYAMGAYFDISGSGSIDATIDHTFAGNVIGVWLAKGRCTADQFEVDACQYVHTSFGTAPPLLAKASGQSAGTFTLIVWNGGPDDESVSYQVVFAQAAAGSGTVSASASEGSQEANGFLVRTPARLSRGH